MKRAFPKNRVGVGKRDALAPASTTDSHSLPDNVVKTLDTVITQPLPRRKDEAEKKYLELAAQQLQQEQEERKRRIQEENVAVYGERSIVNKKKTIDFPKPRDTNPNPLLGPAITLYSDSLSKGTHLHGMTPAQGPNTFGKTTSFSKPISEYTGGATRLE